MSIDPKRWTFTWLLLSLERVTPFWDDMWLPARDQGSLQSEIRRVLNGWLNGAGFTEPTAVNLDVLGAISAAAGTPMVTFLRDWCEHILIKGGPDRAQEAFWSSICGYLGRHAGPPIPDWIRDRCRAVTSKELQRGARIEKQLDRTKHQGMDGWDSKILKAVNRTTEDIDDSVELVARQNGFLLSWWEECRDLSLNQLATLAETVDSVRPHIGMVGVDVGVPGVWVYELADFIEHQSSQAKGPIRPA